jgi:hypothetical protein
MLLMRDAAHWPLCWQRAGKAAMVARLSANYVSMDDGRCYGVHYLTALQRCTSKLAEVHERASHHPNPHVGGGWGMPAVCGAHAHQGTPTTHDPTTRRRNQDLGHDIEHGTCDDVCVGPWTTNSSPSLCNQRVRPCSRRCSCTSDSPANEPSEVITNSRFPPARQRRAFQLSRVAGEPTFVVLAAPSALESGV